MMALVTRPNPYVDLFLSRDGTATDDKSLAVEFDSIEAAERRLAQENADPGWWRWSIRWRIEEVPAGRPA